jgi:hypothetical protein
VNTTKSARDSRWVPTLAQTTINRIVADRLLVMTARPDTYEGKANRAERLAVLYEREAAWWLVLARWVWRSHPDGPRVFAQAASQTAYGHSERAAFWRDSASDWRRREAGLPVCSVIGCGCGGNCDLSGVAS